MFLSAVIEGYDWLFSNGHVLQSLKNSGDEGICLFVVR